MASSHTGIPRDSKTSTEPKYWKQRQKFNYSSGRCTTFSGKLLISIPNMSIKYAIMNTSWNMISGLESDRIERRDSIEPYCIA